MKNIRHSIEYQRGYEEGFKEGFNQAYEKVSKMLLVKRLSEPIIVTSDEFEKYKKIIK